MWFGLLENNSGGQRMILLVRRLFWWCENYFGGQKIILVVNTAHSWLEQYIVDVKNRHLVKTICG